MKLIKCLISLHSIKILVSKPTRRATTGNAIAAANVWLRWLIGKLKVVNLGWVTKSFPRSKETSSPTTSKAKLLCASATTIWSSTGCDIRTSRSTLASKTLSLGGLRCRTLRAAISKSSQRFFQETTRSNTTCSVTPSLRGRKHRFEPSAMGCLVKAHGNMWTSSQCQFATGSCVQSTSAQRSLQKSPTSVSKQLLSEDQKSRNCSMRSTPDSAFVELNHCRWTTFWSCGSGAGSKRLRSSKCQHRRSASTRPGALPSRLITMRCLSTIKTCTTITTLAMA